MNTDAISLRDFSELCEEVLVQNYWPMDQRTFARMDWTEEKQLKHEAAELALRAVQSIVLAPSWSGLTLAEAAIWRAFQPVLEGIRNEEVERRAAEAAEDAEHERLNRKYAVGRMHVHDLDHTVGFHATTDEAK